MKSIRHNTIIDYWGIEHDVMSTREQDEEVKKGRRHRSILVFYG